MSKFCEIFNHSSEDMVELPDGCVHLAVTSPPYNVGMEYEQDLKLDDYLEFLSVVWKECYRVLCKGGRICVNIAGTFQNPYVPLHAFVIEQMLRIGFEMRGEIVWNKGMSGKGFSSTAWGSWRSASNPVLREIHEYILIFSKEQFNRPPLEKKSLTMTPNEFMDYTQSVWEISRHSDESSAKLGHPAPFPVELAHRLIKLYSFEGDIVLDPFMGSGTTALAAQRLKRQWVGYEVEKRYIKLAEGRLLQIDIDLDGHKKRG